MRLITRSDFDGLVCAVLLRQVSTIDTIDFVHPKDVQDGKIQVTANDVLTNLPFVPGAGLWFDHHSSEASRNDMSGVAFQGRFEVAPSAARVVYNYFAEQGKSAQLERYADLLEAVDKSDSANLSHEDVTNPSGWILLSYVMDPRTGLAYFHNYRISNRELMMKMVDWIPEHDVDTILRMPDVKERIDRYFEGQEEFRKIMQKHSTVEDNVIVTDLRGIGDMPTGNRFLIYTMYPNANIQVRVFDGKKGEFIVAAVGHSIFNRTSKTDVGKLMARYGGGGHRGAGTCQLPLEGAEEKVRAIIDECKRDG
jgi:oligoribonuclease NrnB/cAMP/cGMP phosphodiesterase (DHH superfamily)